MGENHLNVQRNLWENPWGYVESFFIGFGLIITGLFLEVISTSKNTFTISYPYNVIFLVSYIVLLFVLFKWFSNSQIIRWLTKVPASISSIALVTLMVMIMGIIPQVSSQNNLINKDVFILSDESVDKGNALIESLNGKLVIGIDDVIACNDSGNLIGIRPFLHQGIQWHDIKTTENSNHGQINTHPISTRNLHHRSDA